MNSIPERLRALRERMQGAGLTHYLIPSADENVNEYLPAWRQRRPWASGFTGSAGDLLVGTEAGETWLFTDGRYHVQAEIELEGSGIGLQKVGAEGSMSLLKMLGGWTAEESSESVLGYDPMVLPLSTRDAVQKALKKSGASLRAVAGHLVDDLWEGRPQPPETPLISCPLEWTGLSFAEKLGLLRADLEESAVDATVAVRLDQIAWLTNLRSLDDIPYNPTFESFLYVGPQEVHLFLNGPERRLPDGFGADLEGFFAHSCAEFLPFLKQLSGLRVAIDPDRVTAGILEALEQGREITVRRLESHIERRKAIKNKTELKCMEHANLVAGAAKTKAMFWLQRELAANREVTERSFRQKIESLYAETEGYQGLSFETISAAAEHGAIIHYGAADETPLRKGELFLIDSGIQAGGGTTDATRTFALGEGTDEQRRIFTLVLKAHIRAVKQVFPKGTPGTAIDSITRSALWSEKLNYSHGTGHGVGAFLNVHEGPFGIADHSRPAAATHALEPGMVTSIEPGYYEPSFGGVRHENLYTIRVAEGGDVEGAWLEFFPLTWIPFDTRLVDESLLDEQERAWFHWYHEECVRRLKPHLTAEENEMLGELLCHTRRS